jgi:hypothetical protein
MKEPPGGTNATGQYGSNMLGGSVLQAVGDESLDASSQEFLLHLPGMFDVGFMHDRCDVVSDDRVAKAREQPDRSVCHRCDCFFDVQCGAPHPNTMRAPPRELTAFRGFAFAVDDFLVVTHFATFMKAWLIASPKVLGASRGVFCSDLRSNSLLRSAPNIIIA